MARPTNYDLSAWKSILPTSISIASEDCPSEVMLDMNEFWQETSPLGKTSPCKMNGIQLINNFLSLKKAQKLAIINDQQFFK